MKLVDLNDGQQFSVSDKVILCREYESMIAVGKKIGINDEQIMYMFTFSGKLNNKERSGDFTIAMSPEDAYNLGVGIFEGLEKLIEANDVDKDQMTFDEVGDSDGVSHEG